MQILDVDELKEVHNVDDAQKALDGGWRLLTVLAAPLNPALDGNSPAYARIYVLGRKRPADKKELPVIDPEKMADLGRRLG